MAIIRTQLLLQNILVVKQLKTNIFLESYLLILGFENKNVLGITYFYKDDSFVPKLPMSYVIWIIFGKQNIKNCMIQFHLDKLDM